MQKSVMTTNGNTVHLSMPFAKVDENKRLVSGYATLDNIDSQGDVVLAEASAAAFARARGNIREMHQPIAVGKMVDFEEQEFFHDGEFYRGIFVTAHVSEGAEDTWKKVLDGTLTGFSIGGEINEASNEFVKEAGKTVRFIKDYDLTELSLVDNPANQLANVLSIQKSATGSVTVTMGEVADAEVENVFICKSDDTVVVKATESESCPMCGLRMENIGWFETGDNRARKVQDIVTKFRNPAKEAAPTDDEGGVEMGKKDEVTKSDETVPEAKETSVPNPSEEHEDGTKIETEAKGTVESEAADVDEVSDEEESEDAESPEEVTDEETEISKKIDALHEAIKDSLEETKTETVAKVSELEKKIDDATQSFLAKATELEERIEGFGPKLEAQKARLAELERSLEKVNSADAFRKSADAQPAEQTVQKPSFWDGAFS